MLAFATETSVVFLLTLYLQQVRGYTPLQAGLAFAVLGVGTVLGGIIGSRVIGRAIVGFMVTATSGLPDAEQGLATGLTTMSQQIGITLGTPVMSVVAITAGAGAVGGVGHGVATALLVNAASCLVAALLFAVALPATRKAVARRADG